MSHISRATAKTQLNPNGVTGNGEIISEVWEYKQPVHSHELQPIQSFFPDFRFSLESLQKEREGLESVLGFILSFARHFSHILS